MKKVAVILAGSGVYDGSEIHEATLALLYLDQAGAQVKCFAPDKDQMHVINHTKGEPAAGETRNVLVESARIARGEIDSVSNLKLSDFDAVVFPGGFGAAKNLCDFAVKGTDCEIDAEIGKLVRDAAEAGKVIGTMCISPVLIACALKDTGRNPKLTIGTDEGTMGALKAFNAEPIKAQVDEIVVDEANRIISTPAYMLGQSIKEIAVGIEKLVKKVVELA